MVITTMLSSKLCSDTDPYHQHTIAAESLHISPVAKTPLTLLFIPVNWIYKSYIQSYSCYRNLENRPK